jgi:CRISPR/Cas system CSM-associated protein Csm3 (group 7 of RAMP superfamily)
MSLIDINFTWRTESPLAIRAGFAGGGIDALVRERDGKPEIPGEAVKGAVREAAERMLRWQNFIAEPNSGDPWLPKTPRMQRLFARELVASGSAPLYKFNGAAGTSAKKLSLCSTAIEYKTGLAKDETLRTLEYWAPGIEFAVLIKGRNGNWQKGGMDYSDLLFLLAAILTVESVGGDQASGGGCVTIGDLNVEGDTKIGRDDLPILFANWVPEVA